MSVNVQISGIVWDKFDKAGRPVQIVGEMTTDVGSPPPGGGGGDKPPHIWGGPIDPYPGHPLPEPPPEYPNPPAAVKPPPATGGWGYHSDYGWGYFPMGGPIPGPK